MCFCVFSCVILINNYEDGIIIIIVLILKVTQKMKRLVKKGIQVTQLSCGLDRFSEEGGF